MNKHQRFIVFVWQLALALVVFFCMPWAADQAFADEKDYTSFTSLLGNGKKAAFSSFVENARAVRPLDEENRFGVVHVALDAASDVVGWKTFDTTLTGAVEFADIASYIFEYVNGAFKDFGIGAHELQFENGRFVWLSPSLLTVTYFRHYNNVEVRDAFVRFMFMKSETGKFHLREYVNRSYGKIEIANPDLPPATHRDVIKASNLLTSELVGERPIIFTSEVDEAYRFYLAREFKLKVMDETFTITMLNGEKAPVEAYSSKSASDKERILKGEVYERSYLSNFVTYHLPLTKYGVAGQGYITDRDGKFEYNGDAKAQVFLASNRVALHDNGNSTAYLLDVDLIDSDELILEGNTNDLRALNAYTAIHRINSFTRHFLSPTEATYLEKPVKVNINKSDFCNAYYESGSNTISLFSEGEKEGKRCANMALVNDVIYHEWGHGLDNNIGIKKGITDGAFSEGFSDLVAAYYVGDSRMGTGFFLNNKDPLRNLKNTKRYPDDKGQVHDEGQIIAGAFWDLRVEMIKRYGEIKGAYLAGMLFFRHGLITDFYTDSYTNVLALDDDDGNSATPSPNHCLITKAFADHGLAKYNGCKDKVAVDQVLVDASIYVGIKSSDADGELLMASSETAESLDLCWGHRDQCLKDSAEVELRFKKEGLKDGKNIFLASSPIRVKEFTVITIVARDSQGEITGARTVKFVTK